MAKQTINIGSTANDGTGDPLRTAFDKCNDNFDELYDIPPGTGTLDDLSDVDAYEPADGDILVYDASGGAWMNMPNAGGGGGSLPWWFSPPLASDFTINRSGDANNVAFNADSANTGASLTANDSVATAPRVRMKNKALPGGDYILDTHIRYNADFGSNDILGITLHESATGKTAIFGIYYSGSVMRLCVFRTTLTAFTATPRDVASVGQTDIFLRVVRNGATMEFWHSRDGEHFVLFTTVPVTTAFTTAADEVGLGCYLGATGVHDVQLTCDRWVQNW